jgi:hypothetical protein
MIFFKAQPPVPAEEFEWLLACFAWLRKVLEDEDREAALVLPGHPALQAARTGPDLFAAVRDLAGMGGWPCRLERVDDHVQPGDTRVVQEGASACGTFSIEGGEAVIRYSSRLLSDPDALAATFAHEVCHYLLAAAGDPPGGPDLMEHATDCAAAYLGFGVFLANSARSFEQWSDGTWGGWRSSTSGYLSEQALVTATAMFCALQGHEGSAAEQALKPYLRGGFRKAHKALARDHPDLAGSLRQVDLGQWA